MASSKERKKEQGWGILMAIVFTAAPFGFGVPIKYACISWAVAWLASVHLMWNLEVFAQMGTVLKIFWALLLTVTLLYFSYPAIRTANIREKARATSGDLVADDDGKDHSSDPPLVQVGTRGGTLTPAKPGEPILIYNGVEVSDPLIVEMVDGRVLLTTSVRAKDGSLIVDIIKNHWIVASSTSTCWDKNYTDDRLEVKDGKGRVVLQLRVLPNIVQFQVEWHEEKGQSGGIFDDGYSVREGISPKFKYPSELYWGELK